MDKVSTGSDWIHWVREIKYDSCRMMLTRNRDRVRLIGKGDHDRAERFPLIVSSR
jgi:ATP-dependent DNA ligase